MFRTVICFTPFLTCLFWFVVFALRYRKHNPAKKVLTWFLLTCIILYFCHGLYFSGIKHHILESVWILCSLSVYPIYYLYLRALTTNISNNGRRYLVLIPGILIFALNLFWSGRVVNYLRLFLFTVQIVCVCWYGAKMLKAFDQKVASCYADIDDLKTTDVHILLRAFVLMSCLSVLANVIGKSVFASDDALLFPVAILFTLLLFALSYIGYTKDFSYKELIEENSDEVIEHLPNDQYKILGQKLDELMETEKLFEVANLKIDDVATRLGSCRTYVSNCINQSKGESFSDYINRLRIEEAKSILKTEAGIKNIVLAERVGFTNEQSFYRNFKKFTGLTPAEWKKSELYNM